jgi:hypothetical protein
VREEHEGDAEGDQDGAEEEGEAHAEEDAQGSLALFCRDILGQGLQGTSLVAEHGAKNIYVRNDPELDFAARLPEQIAASAYNQDPNDA